MKILISGATGFVGTALYMELKKRGHEAKVLSRVGWDTSGDSIYWNPEKREIDVNRLDGFDAVVHLAGENIGKGRWTEQKKNRIRDSRIHGTTFLAETLSTLQKPPKVFVSASAVGYYGNRGTDVLKEESTPGTGFLADVCQAWEKATAAASAKGIRVVNIRTGIVLGKNGGALCQMLLPFKLGVGGIIGDGKQFMSWIHLDDAVGAILLAVENPFVAGAINLVSPKPVTNAEFTDALGSALCRPTLLPMPAFAARLAFGEMADALLLSSSRVEPAKLVKAGFVFKYPELPAALHQILS